MRSQKCVASWHEEDSPFLLIPAISGPGVVQTNMEHILTQGFWFRARSVCRWSSDIGECEVPDRTARLGVYQAGGEACQIGKGLNSRFSHENGRLTGQNT